MIKLKDLLFENNDARELARLEKRMAKLDIEIDDYVGQIEDLEADDDEKNDSEIATVEGKLRKVDGEANKLVKQAAELEKRMRKGRDSLKEAVDPKFEKHANEYIKRVQKASDVRMKKDVPNVPTPTFSFDKGRRYWRVVSKAPGSNYVHSFLDTTTGDVLKAAGWKSPAKHARGNIYKPDYGMSGVGDYGAKYLR